MDEVRWQVVRRTNAASPWVPAGEETPDFIEADLWLHARLACYESFRQEMGENTPAVLHGLRLSWVENGQRCFCERPYEQTTELIKLTFSTPLL